MNLKNESLAAKDVEIPADRHVRDAERFGQIAHADPAQAADLGEDPCMAHRSQRSTV